MKSLLIYTLMPLIPALAFANSAEQDFQYLCSYDKKWCGKLKNSDGTFVRPKKEILQLLKELAPTIEKHSSTLGVDPRAVAGAIMAENSLNVSISDDVQNLLVKIGVANKGEILGKRFTYGLGQLNFSAAREAENYAAKLENRQPLEDKELSDALLVPDKAIYYVAGVIRKVQDDYKAQGLDISGSPEILATLYNLGHASTKASSTKNSGSVPKPNYFGFFVKKYESDLSFLKKAAPKIEEKKKVMLAEKSPVPAPPPALPDLKLKPVKAAAVEKKEVKIVFTKSLPLYTSPPVCDSSNEYGATNIKRKYDSLKNFAVSGIVEKNSSFQILAPTVDCEANLWELVKSSTGEVGWIKKDDLENNSAKVALPVSKCSDKQDLKCIQKIKEDFKDSFLGSNSTEVQFKPFSRSEKVSFKKPDWSCAEQSQNNDSNNNAGSFLFGYNGRRFFGVAVGSSAKKIMAPSHTIDEWNSTLDKIDEKFSELEKFYQAPIDSPKNPYANSNLPMMKYSLKRCVEKQSFKLDNCGVDISSVEKILGDIIISKKIPQDELALLNHNAMLVSMGEKTISKKDLKAMTGYGSMGGMMPGIGVGGYGLGGYGLGAFGLPAQYLFREGDEKLWEPGDLEQAYKRCEESLEEISKKVELDKTLSSKDLGVMRGSLDAMKFHLKSGARNSLRKLLLLPEEEKTKAFQTIQPDFVQVAKVCLSLEDTFQLKLKNSTSSPALRNYNCFYQNLEVLDAGQSLMLKEMINDFMYTPDGFFLIENLFELGFLPSAAAVVNSPTVTATTKIGDVDNDSISPSSYCPNRTAELIENLVKNYPCVGKVYVPDRWLINRLNDSGNKIIYKPFAQDDRFSFSVENNQCN